MLAKSIEEHHNKSIYKDIVEEYDVESENLKVILEGNEEIHRKMHSKIIDPFVPGWNLDKYLDYANHQGDEEEYKWKNYS